MMAKDLDDLPAGGAGVLDNPSTQANKKKKPKSKKKKKTTDAEAVAHEEIDQAATEEEQHESVAPSFSKEVSPSGASTGELARALKELETTKTELKLALSQRDVLLKESEEAKSQLGRLNEDYTRLTNEVTSARAEIDQLRSRELHNTKALAEVQKLAELEAALIKACEENEVITRKLDEMNESHAQLLQQLQEAKINAEDEETIEELQRARIDLQLELGAVKDQLDKANEALQRQPLEEMHSYDTVVRNEIAPNRPAPWKMAGNCLYAECALPFTFFRRQHHCRACGDSVCAAHSSNAIPWPVRYERVCDSCFEALVPS